MYLGKRRELTGPLEARPVPVLKERRSLRTFAVVSLRPGSLAFNAHIPRRLSTPSDAFEPPRRRFAWTLEPQTLPARPHLAELCEAWGARVAEGDDKKALIAKLLQRTP